MAQRFIICTDGSENAPTAKERDRITDLLMSKNLDVWHWFEDLWLVVDNRDEYNASGLRDEIQKCFTRQKKNVLVLQTETRNYSGYGPGAAWKWMKRKWDGNPL